MKLKVHHGIENYVYENRNYLQTHCNDRRNTFHFACRQKSSYNNPGILT